MSGIDRKTFENKSEGNKSDFMQCVEYEKELKMMEIPRRVIPCTIPDIAKRKRTVIAVYSEKEHMNALLRSMSDGVITTDTQGRIAIMNKAAEELCGWKQNEAQRKPFMTVLTIIDGVTRAPHENIIDKALAAGKSIELGSHAILIFKGGGERMIAGSAAPIKDGNDKISGVVLLLRDITEKHKLLEASLKQQKLKFLGGLADSIVHDFNNLICGTFGYIDIALDESKDDKVTHPLSIAIQMIQRARDLTEQLLVFTNGRALVKEPLQILPIIQDIAQLSLCESNVSCRFDGNDDLWPCAIDKKQICLVITNIIINAQQAMPQGGIIDVSAKNISFSDNQHDVLPKGDYVKVSMTDYGVGISKEKQPSLFSPFFTTKPKHHGLGLAICSIIIIRHGGTIEVESVVDKGTTFHLYLPVSTNSVIVNAAPSQPSRPPAARYVKPKNGGRIIVMDDEETIRDIVGKMLEMLGYSAVGKKDGREALNFFIEETKANRPFTALILDLIIPGGMGGKDLVREIRKLDSNIPVFVASGYTNDPIMEVPANYGFTASLYKPFRKIELEEMLEKYLTKPSLISPELR
jgi:PAS domain S-box-containing protein